MRYVILCRNCSHGEFGCDEIRCDVRCPHCHSIPGSYTDNGEVYCWLHREPILATYHVSDTYLFTTYGWRGRESAFPNAKHYETRGKERACGTSTYCCKCQQAYEEWTAEQ